MEVNTTGIQYEDINALRKYPLAESSTCVDDSGFQLPQNIVIDMCVVAFSSVSGLYLSYLHVGDRLLSAAVSDGSGVVATLTVVDYSDDSEYTMVPARTGVSVVISFGKLKEHVGETYKFSNLGQSSIHSFCVVDVPGSVVECVVDDASGERFTGKVSFVFSGGISASVDETSRVSLKASDAIEKTLSGGCTPTDLNKSCIVPVIQSINGIKPNEFGEIALVLE